MFDPAKLPPGWAHNDRLAESPSKRSYVSVRRTERGWFGCAYGPFHPGSADQAFNDATALAWALESDSNPRALHDRLDHAKAALAVERATVQDLRRTIEDQQAVIDHLRRPLMLRVLQWLRR